MKSSFRKKVEPIVRKVVDNQSLLWKPPSEFKFTPHNEWIQKYENPEADSYLYRTVLEEAEYPRQTIAAQRIDLHLNDFQKQVFQRWCMAYVMMYNETLRYIKCIYRETGKLLINFRSLRTNHLKPIRDQIKAASYLEEYGTHTQIMTHMLDAAIKLVCAGYKSAVTNLKKGNIKSFRIRYLRKKRFYRLDVEQQYIKETGICPLILGEMRATYDGEALDWRTIHSDSQLLYDSEADKYYLLVPKRRNTAKVESRKSWIALDPGIRTFMTGFSNHEILEVGSAMDTKIKQLHQKLDGIEKRFTKKKRKKKRKRCARKMENIVKDLHWKTIQYLVQNYDHILIGKLSTKGIVSKKNYLSSMTKRVGMTLSHYTFRQRLQFKADQYHSTVHIIDESYTTKMCSCCGWVNFHIGGSKVFDCKKCKHICDRDVDAGRMIAFKGLF